MVTSVKLRSSWASTDLELSPFSVLVDNVECAAGVGIAKGGDARVPCRRVGRQVRSPDLSLDFSH